MKRTFERFEQGGRDNIGSKNPRAKLTEAEVHEIRESKDPPAKLARDYDVPLSIVRDILARRTWAHLNRDDDDDD